jgi:S-adenosylmethionine:tRNA ribosyltransferase-isomerase
MALRRDSGKTEHHSFSEFPSFLRAGDALVINDTRVVPARIFGITDKGASVELLIVGPVSENGEAQSMIKGLKKMEPGRVMDFGNTLTGEFVRREHDSGVVRFSLHGDELRGWLERYGHVPLPPYIKRDDEPIDRERYQTVFASPAFGRGSCAAPTAGLHFTERMLGEIEAKGVKVFRITLHVGPGTFRPVTQEDVSRHRLNAEYTEVPRSVYEELTDIKSSGGRVTAVGSTTTRALETAAIRGGGFTGETDLFISPGFKFKMADALVTNFHLPRSSLLFLVSAFAGREKILRAYEEAVRKGYRFYSYGDAMFIY